MGLFDAIVRLFSSSDDDDNQQPSQEDAEAAALADEFTREGGEGEEYFEEGVDMGTVPATPVNDGSDTDPEQNVGLLRRLLGW